MTNYTKYAFKGFLIIFVMTLLGTIVSYIFRLVLARNLTVSEYGLYYSVYSILAVLFVFRDFGSGSALSKYIPEFMVKKKWTKIKSSIIISVATAVSIGALLSILTIIFSKLIAVNYLKIPEADMFVKLMGVAFFLLTIDGVIVNILVGFQKHWLYSLFQFLRQLLPLIFILLLFIFSKNVYSIGFSLIMTSLAILVFFILIFNKRVMPTFWKIPTFVNKEIFLKLMRFGAAIVFVGMGALILQFTDTILITGFFTTEQSGIYNAAIPISNILLYIGIALSTVVFPLTAELWARKMRDKLANGVTLFYRYSFWILLPVSFIVLAFSELIIALLFGPRYIMAAGPLRVLVIGTTLYLIAQMNFAVFSGIEKPGLVAKITIFGALINVALNLLLIPKFGLIGAAISTSLSYFIMAITSVALLKRYISIKIPIINWIMTVLLCVVMLLFIGWLKSTIALEPYFEAIIISIASAAMYIALSYVTKQINLREIKFLYRLLTKK